MVYEVDIGIKLLACGLGTVRTGLEGFGPVKVKKKENINKPAIQGPQWSCVCVISGVPVRWGIPWHYTVVLWHPSMMNNARLRRCAQAKI